MLDTKPLTFNFSKLLKIGLFANIIEWYEFLVYMHLSEVISELFFKSTTRIQALIQTFALFAISYLVRPVGSLFFGYFGDKYGTQASLKISLLMMSIPTVLIGLLPTYREIGYFATGLLCGLRLIQGFAAGGEFPVSACYVFETAPPRTRSFLCGVVSNSSMIGSLLGSMAASSLFLCFTSDTLLAWAWRIPFLLGLPLTFWIVSIRKNCLEPLSEGQKNTKVKNPFQTILTSERVALLKGLSLCAFSSVVGVYTLSMWMPFYLTHFLNYPPAIAHSFNTSLLLFSILFAQVAAWSAHYLGFHRIIQISILLSLILVYPLFRGLQGASWMTTYLILLTLKLLLSAIGGVIIEALGSLFTHARSTGMSIAFTFPTAIFGGITPLICTYLTNKLGLLTFPAFYVMLFGLLALPAALSLKIDKSLT